VKVLVVVEVREWSKGAEDEVDVMRHVCILSTLPRPGPNWRLFSRTLSRPPTSQNRPTWVAFVVSASAGTVSQSVRQSVKSVPPTRPAVPSTQARAQSRRPRATPHPRPSPFACVLAAEGLGMPRCGLDARRASS
jgi:hypothetical protein